MKRIIFLLPILMLLISCGASQNITAIHVLAFNSQITLEEGCESEPMYFTVESAKAFDISDISFVSENPNIASVEYDNSTILNCVYYKISALQEGVTTLHFSANDGQVCSESITVTVTSSGQEDGTDYIEVFGQSSLDVPPQEADALQAVIPSADCTYVLNTNSKKFHDKNCSKAKTIKDSNYSEYAGTRDELLSQGYTPCGSCKP